MSEPTPVGFPEARPVLDPATVAVTAGRPPYAPDAPLNEPVVFASAYHAGGPVAYGRDGNPTWTAFEMVLGGLEGGTALAFASGLAAIAAVFETVPVGGVIVLPRDGYSGTRSLLAAGAPPGRWEMRTVDVTDTAAVLAACDGAALLFVETPTNPKLELADLPALVKGAHAGGVPVAVDNTCATPLGQRPLAMGADVVVHSVTKFLAGHSDLVLGATVTRDAEMCGRLRFLRSRRGAIPGPMEVWLALRGLRTLAVRYERAQANAAELARRLAGHQAVERVRYPGFGTMVAFDLAGAAPAEALAKATELIVHATSLGGIETTMERRARWKGEVDIPAGLLRLSVGCEHVDDLWHDLERGLRVAAHASGSLSS